MFTVSSGFIGNFKLGDNINHNLSVLALLYRYYGKEDQNGKGLLRKPIIITLVSIIEAVLHDFHGRIRIFTYEGVVNLPSDIANYVRSKTMKDELGKYIASAKKHNLFAAQNVGFYDLLDELRRLRNRVHIQNTKDDFEPDDWNAFTEVRKEKAEKSLEKTLKIMAAKYPRPKHARGYVTDFELPWPAHFQN
jgi:hypothetical protein